MSGQHSTSWLDKQKAGLAEAKAHIDEGAQRQREAHDTTPRPTVDGGTQAVAWIIAILSLGYMLPWAVATSRQMPNHGGIAIVNLLTGWTGVGWLVALVMACMQPRP